MGKINGEVPGMRTATRTPTGWRPDPRLHGRARLSVTAVFEAVLILFATVVSARRGELLRVLRGGYAPVGRTERGMALRLPPAPIEPAGVLALPRGYVERAGVQEVVDGLMSPGRELAPYAIVGEGGSGKTVLASAVVREPSVSEHYSGGIFWVEVGRDAKNNLLPLLLLSLTREMGTTPADAPLGVPDVFESLEEARQHLTVVTATSTSPRLLVLDDVRGREVVDAFRCLGFKVLVTTRDGSVVSNSGGSYELGDMTEDEALELLLKSSATTVGRPGNDVRRQMTKVRVVYTLHVLLSPSCVF